MNTNVLVVHLSLSQKKMNPASLFFEKAQTYCPVRSLSKKMGVGCNLSYALMNYKLFLKCFAQLCTLNSDDPVYIMYNQN